VRKFTRAIGIERYFEFAGPRPRHWRYGDGIRTTTPTHECSDRIGDLIVDAFGDRDFALMVVFFARVYSRYIGPD
jgi:hypothetical protein